jgi:hypothetical protein
MLLSPAVFIVLVTSPISCFFHVHDDRHMHHLAAHNHDHECGSGQDQWMDQMSHHECSVVPEKGVWDW